MEEGRESVVGEVEGEVQESCALSEICDDEPGQEGEEVEGENGEQSLVEGQMGVVDEGDERR